jgi:hypothetical protein
MESNSGAFHHSTRPGTAHESASSQAGCKRTDIGAGIKNTITITRTSRAAGGA